jgi:hypothetical protein
LFGSLYDPVSEGSQAVQIEVGGDLISQSFTTIIGKSYELSFDLSAYSGYGPNFEPCPCNSNLKVTVGSISEPELISYDLVGHSEIGYVRHTLPFTANSTELILTFKNSAEPPGIWWNYPQIDNVVVNAVLTPPFLTVAIDIKPGSYPNSINLKSKGVVPVAILSSSIFNIIDVDVSTVIFAGAAPERFTHEDVNSDGFYDLVFHFHTQDLQLLSNSTEATLTGNLMGGLPIIGTDSVRIVPSGPKSKP